MNKSWRTLLPAPTTLAKCYLPLAISVGALLVIAAGLKGWGSETHADHTFGSPSGDLALVIGEGLFGVWLMLGFLPAWSRRVCILLFVVFANYAIVQYLNGKSSCNCMGAASIRPIFAMVLDAIVILSLVAVSHRSGSALDWSARTFNVRRVAFGVAILGSLVWAVVRQSAITDRTTPTASVAANAELIREVVLPRIEGIEAKTASLIMETKDTLTSMFDPERPESYVITRRYSCKQGQIRRDSFRLSGDKKELIEVVVLSGNRFLQYDTQQKFVNVRQTDDRELAIATDIRCIAFHTPITRVSEWLRSAKTLDIQVDSVAPMRTIRTTVEEPPLDGKARRHTVEIVLEERFSFLPTRVEYRRANGGLYSTVKLEYRVLQPGMPVLESAHFEFFGSKSESTGSVKIETSKEPLLNPVIADSEFDPTFPAGTKLGGNLSLKANMGDRAVPVSQVTSDKVQPMVEQKAVGFIRTHWLALSVFNAMLILVCVGEVILLAQVGRAPNSPIGPNPEFQPGASP